MDWSEHYKTDAGYRDWPNEELVRFMSGQPKGGRLLEVGCGGGGNLRLLSRHGSHVTGIDTFGPALAYADVLLDDNERAATSLVRADLFDVPTLRDSFDGVIDCMVSQHVPWADHEKAYRGYHRVMNPGGWFWLYHLDSRNHEGVVKDRVDFESLQAFPTVPFFCLPTARRLMRVVEAAGFEVWDWHKTSRWGMDGTAVHYSIIEARAL